MSSLGDCHNFGRRVTRRGSVIDKSRPILWERLVLSDRSPLRRALDRIAASHGEPSAFGFLPSLSFGRARASDFGGLVERISLAAWRSKSAHGRRELAAAFGRLLAIASFLGISDLHWENLVLGADRRGRLVFGPLDVESLFDDQESPTETKLLPEADPEIADVCRHAAGARRILPYLGKPIAPSSLLAMVDAYDRTLAWSIAHRRELAAAIVEARRVAETPVRVCLRGTDEYVRARTELVWPPLLDEEATQLVRGDVPYFFRLVGDRRIRFWTDAKLQSSGALPTRGDVPKLPAGLSPLRGLRSAHRTSLHDRGVLALVAAFDHDALTGAHREGELAIELGARRIAIHTRDRTIRAPRDLQAFGASVYLPCRCGEVRTPFVPKVTRCDADPVHGRRGRGTRGA